MKSNKHGFILKTTLVSEAKGIMFLLVKMKQRNKLKSNQKDTGNIWYFLQFLIMGKRCHSNLALLELKDL